MFGTSRTVYIFTAQNTNNYTVYKCMPVCAAHNASFIGSAVTSETETRLGVMRDCVVCPLRAKARI